MGFIKKIKDKVAYERESFRMSGEHLKRVMEDHPDPGFRKRIRMTDAQYKEWQRQERARRKRS